MTTRSGAKRSNSRAQNGHPSKLRQAAADPSPDKQLAKVTLYVRPDQVVAIETIQLDERRRTGSRPDKSALVQEALDLLISKYRPST
ncbi:MAG: hypothetical protein ACJ74G_04405 [Blastocatellia bacterium]